MTNAPEVFARYLDLSPLRGKLTGLVRCRFHEDSAPSLSVDLARGLFHCFGCGEQGGVRAFLRRVGEEVEPATRRELTALEEVVELARRQSWSQPGVVDSYHRADEARGLRRRADECRRYATAHPMDDETRWGELLADAAWYDTEACRVESQDG